MYTYSIRQKSEAIIRRFSLEFVGMDCSSTNQQGSVSWMVLEHGMLEDVRLMVWYCSFLEWWYTQIIHFHRAFHCIPSVFGIPSMETAIYDPEKDIVGPTTTSVNNYCGDLW